MSASNSYGTSAFSNTACATVPTSTTGGTTTTLVTVNFDNPAPSGSAGSWLTTFGGINWGSQQWAWWGPEAGMDSTNHVDFGASGVTSRQFSFSSAPQMLKTVTFVSLASGTATLKDNNGQTSSVSLVAGQNVVATTNWATASTTVTVTISVGWDGAITALTYQAPGTTTPTAPAAPTGLTATVSGSAIALKWTDNATNESNYLVDRALGTGAFSRLATLAAGTTAYTDSAVTAGQQYCYRVSASNSAGTSAYSATACATVPATTPPPPPPTTASLCGALPAPTGPTVTVSTASALSSAVANAASGTTIYVADGTYTGVNLVFRTSNVTVRSLSGNRDHVVIDGNYSVNEIMSVYAAHITIADMTLQRAKFHPVHAGGGGNYLTLYNLHIVDGGEQFVKVNPDTSGNYNDYGTLACSTLELTSAGRNYIQTTTASLTGFPCYTGGLDAHAAQGWEVRDNTIQNIYCTTGLAEHGIHFWNSSRDMVVERNKLLNDARGIGFGMGNSVTTNLRTYSDNPLNGTGLTASQVQTIGGVIKNNFVWANITQFDTAIGLESAWGASIYHNTVYGPTSGLGIDIRFSVSNPIVKNNLALPGIDTRDGGYMSASGGNMAASPSMFVNAAAGNLHLIAGVAPINAGVSLNGLVPTDIDGDTRSTPPDIGADEYVG